MLFKKKKKTSQQAAHIIEQYVKASEKRDPENYLYLPEMLFSALSFDPKPQEIRYIGEETADRIRNKDAYEVAHLMHCSYVDPSPADPGQWEKHCTPRGYRALLICGAAHPNGYFRERCLRKLEQEQGVLQFVLLRMNDWVPQIRKAAQDMLPGMLHRASVSEIADAIPFVEHVRRGQRAQRDLYFSMDLLDAILLERFAEQPDTVLSKPIMRRRFCYKVLLLHPDEQYRDLMLYFIQHERDGAQRSALVRAYLQKGSVPLEQQEKFWQDKYWRVRLDAYEYRMKTQGAWDGLEHLLLSGSYPIREFAEYYLEKQGFDSLGYCREHLPESLPALCDLGKKEDIPRIRPYLKTHPRESLNALVRLGAEDSEILIWKYMHSENAKLAKAAYRLAAAQPRFSPAQLLPEIREETDPQLRWRLIRLLGKTGDWELMPILIRLAKDYSHIRCSILDMIRQRSSFRTSISRELYAEIRGALAYADTAIPEQMRNDIIFDIDRLVLD